MLCTKKVCFCFCVFTIKYCLSHNFPDGGKIIGTCIGSLFNIYDAAITQESLYMANSSCLNIHTSIHAMTSLSSILAMVPSSWNSSIIESIRFIKDFTRLVSVVGDNSCTTTKIDEKLFKLCNIGT